MLKGKLGDLMDEYMVAIINGGVEDNGNIIYLGHNFNFNYHAECLIDYGVHKYPNISGFKNIDYMKEPNLPIYYLSLLNNIIFTNVSVDDEMRGMLYLPRTISDEQLKTLSQFIDLIYDFKVTIIYNLALVDGMVLGKDLDVLQNENMKEQIMKFVLERQTSKKERRTYNG